MPCGLSAMPRPDRAYPSMSRYFDIRSTVLIVVGHGILPEEEDRPIAYELKRAVKARAAGSDERSAVVVTDVWIMNHEMGELFPAIAVGGPGVNALTADVYEDLPLVYTRDDEVFVQMAEEGKRAAVWGMSEEATRQAASTFIEHGLLERFLDLVWRRE
jgi:hypothetical protein